MVEVDMTRDSSLKIENLRLFIKKCEKKNEVN